MKPLIDANSPLYLKRLVRALNIEAMAGNGFFAPQSTFMIRCNEAMLHGSMIQVRAVRDIIPRWFYPSRNYFETVNGTEIVASRKP